MSAFEIVLIAAYAIAIFTLALFGLHKYCLLYLFWKYKNKPTFEPGELNPMPVVTVQLPIFNERYVVERLIKAVCALEYPKNLLEIQVLDDSTDETREVSRHWVEHFKKEGYDIQLIHRSERTGYKAGALAVGMQQAKGDYLAIFDADFVPQPDFLKKTVSYFANEEVGMVQTRWGHINQNYSLLTQLQSVFLDGHFVIEHTARNRSGRFFNFNGTAGIWRKTAIEASGGWQHDTLTEDLDLSYRAQLAGWKFVYLPDVIAPSELPVDMNAYKSQQHRWAKGSVQTAKKLLPVILKSSLPRKVKWEALVHLVSNFSYLLMTIPSVFIVPVSIVLFGLQMHQLIVLYLLLFFAATFSLFFFYLVCQREIYSKWWERLRYIPGIFSLAIGISVNNSKAVLEGILNHQSEFKRTPKFRIESKRDLWRNKTYRSEKNALPILEFLFGVYFTIAIVLAIEKGMYMSIPFFSLFQFGFFYSSVMSLFVRRKLIRA